MVAILPARNEVDVIRCVVEHLIAEGLEVYVIDNASTDGTPAAIADLVGHGLLHVEDFPREAGYPDRNLREYVVDDHHRRMEEVIAAIDAEWFLCTAADEITESLLPGRSLWETFALAEAAGYTALHGDLLDFRPTDDSFRPGDDLRSAFAFYERPLPACSLRISAFRKPAGGRVDLRSKVAHSIEFDGRRVFPLPLVIRHYPIRGSAHGRAKVHGERLGRFAPDERARGWHNHYDRYAGQQEFVWDAAALERWDDAGYRLERLATIAADLAALAGVGGVDPAALAATPDAIGRWAGVRAGEGAPVDGHRLDVALSVAAAAASAARDGGCTADVSAVPEPRLAVGVLELYEAAARVGGEATTVRGLEAWRAALSATAGAAAAGDGTTTVLVDGVEVADDPSLLRALGALTATDGVTVVVHVPSGLGEALVEAVAAAACAAGLDADDACEVVVTCDDGWAPAGGRHVPDAVLTRRPRAGRLVGVPLLEDLLPAVRAA